MKGFARESYEARKVSQYYALRLLTNSEWDKLDPILRKRTEMIPGGPLRVITRDAPLGYTETPYTPFQIRAIGGFGARVFTIASGTLPTGLTLSTSGVISGIPSPTSGGSYTFTVKVDCDHAIFATGEMTISVIDAKTFLQPSGIGLYLQPDGIHTYIQP